MRNARDFLALEDGVQYPLMFVAGASHRLPARLTFAATCSLATIASAQWSVINLHPAGASYSEARGVSRGRQVGFAYFGGTHHACLWTGSAQSLIDLNPAGSPEGFAYAVSGERQAGYVDGNDGLYHASVWNATSASWVDLHPKFAGQGSLAYGICLGQQVGVAEYRACLWSNSAASRVDLSPMIGEFFSEALGTSGSQQVGKVYLNSGTRASLWSGSAASWVDLTPVGSIGAEALAVHNGEQVGAVFFEGVSRASLWHGTAASWVDLHPDGAAWSEATGVYGGQQVGHVEIGGVVIASMWSGSADSWENLHTFLPAHFSSSEAFGVWNEAGSTYVAGRGFNTLTGREEALLWRKAAGNGADYDGDGIVDGADNCPESSNADQLDTDGDGMGDACDSCPGAQNMGMDWDYDGIDSACDLDEVMLYAYDERSHVSGSFTLDYVSPSGEERSFDGAADVDFSAMNPVHAVGSGQTGGGLKDEVVVSSTNSMAFEPGRISTVIEGSTQVAEGCTGGAGGTTSTGIRVR